mgnify:CR=1 FL=1
MPLPLPFAPPVMVTQNSPLEAVQLQFDVVVTLTVPVVAADDERVVDVGAIVNVQGAAGCVTVNVWPAIVIVPVRELVVVFASTL